MKKAHHQQRKSVCNPQGHDAFNFQLIVVIGEEIHMGCTGLKTFW